MLQSPEQSPPHLSFQRPCPWVGDITNHSFFMATPRNHSRQEVRISVQSELQKGIRWCNTFSLSSPETLRNALILRMIDSQTVPLNCCLLPGDYIFSGAAHFLLFLSYFHQYSIYLEHKIKIPIWLGYQPFTWRVWLFYIGLSMM